MNEIHILIVLATLVLTFFRYGKNLTAAIANAITVAILIALFPNNFIVTLSIYATIVILFPDALSTIFAYTLGITIYIILAFIKKILLRPFPKLSAYINEKAKQYSKS